ncbi:MAG: BPSS1780 family membrane protein [Burkholderiales bacterium]
MSTPNPYAAPRAPVADAAEAPRNFLPTGRAVPASRGWSWIVDGWALFRRQPGAWIALVIVALLLFIGMALIPILGSLAGMVLTPVFAGGVFAACREQDQGRPLSVSHLFAGFRERFGTLLSIGFIYFGITIAVTLVVAVVTGAGMWTFLGSATDSGAIAGMSLSVVLAGLIMVALLLPVFMALWFAPALAMFHQQGPAEAMKASLVACLKNVLPFLVYSVVAMLLGFVASIPLGLGWLVLGPVMAASLYASYRDIFFDERAAAPQPRQAGELHQP